MSRILLGKEDVKLASVKASVELLLSEITKQNRELFTHQELEDMLLEKRLNVDNSIINGKKNSWLIAD